MESPPQRRSFRFVCLGLLLITAGLYGRMLQHDFITFDDPDYVTQNAQVQNGLSWRGVVWAFTTGHESNWHPLTWLSHQLDCQLFGVNPAGHHFTSLLLHLANTAFLFAALRRMTGHLWRSAIVAALFAWHPLHIESVAWVAERKDVLCGFFWMLGLWLYAGYARHPNWRSYIAVLGCFAAGLMAKPMMVTFPFVLLLLDYWPLRRIPRPQTNVSAAIDFPVQPWRSLVLEKVPFLLLSAASSYLTVKVQNATGAVVALDKLPIGLRIENAIVSILIYLRRTIWPDDLAVFYPHPHGFPAAVLAGAGLALLAVTGVAVWLRRRQPSLLVGWLWFLGTLFPVIGLVQVGAQGMADRYTYIPLIGIFIAATWGAARLAEISHWPMPILRGSAALALTSCVIATLFQLRYWQDPVTLFRRALAVTPDNFIARGNLGNALDNLGRYEEAAEHLLRSAELEPRVPAAFNNLGRHYERAGDLDKAAEFYQKTLRIQPDFLLGHYNLARMLAARGHWAEAEQHFEESLRQGPENASVHYLLGTVQLRQDKFDVAFTHLQAALRLKPNSPRVLGAVALLRARSSTQELRDLAEAVRLAEQANELTGRSDLELLAILDQVYAEAGRFADAIKLAQEIETFASNLRQKAVAGQAAKRLEFYRAGKPYRE